MEKFNNIFFASTSWLTQHARIVIGLMVVGLFVLHANHIVELHFIKAMEGSLYDMRLRATMPYDINEQVVIIDIDEKSLQKEGRWPWSRERLGELVKKLNSQYKVAAFGMDVVFAEPESQVSAKIMERLSRHDTPQNREMKSLLTRLQPLLDGDRAFAHEMKGRNVVMGYFFKRASDTESTIQAGTLPISACDLAQVSGQGVTLQQATGYGANVAALQNAAAGGGHIIPNVDADGIIRSVPLLIAYQGKCYESLALAVIRNVVGATQITIERGTDRWSSYTIKVGEIHIPVMNDASVWIPYRGPQTSFRYISATDVLEGRADPKLLEGTIALLGTTAAGLLDLRETPVGGSYPGIEAHANMVAGMLEYSSIKKSPTAIPGLEGWMLLALGILAAILLGRASPLQVMWISVGAGALISMANLMIWIGASVVLPMASPLMLIATLFVLNMSYGFLSEERTKRLYKERFGQYVSPEVIEEMISNPKLLESMEGTSREMTVLFSDIRNFTSISEGMEPKQLMRMMNEYLTPMTRLIIDKDKYQGTIDKYIGDAIMSFWGAPLIDKNHAQHGVLAALEMQKLAVELSAKFKAQGWAEIRIGVGLNSGVMSVGNMGSSFRRAYTVLGDSVNLAARLEGLTKEYGVGILVSASTKNAAPGIIYRELDRVKVKGKGLAVSIYEPVGIVAEVSAEKITQINQFEHALKLYRTQKWDEAEAILKTMPKEDEVLVKLYSNRIAEKKVNPPGVEWDGVTVFTTK